jgi:hypothetical protein
MRLKILVKPVFTTRRLLAIKTFCTIILSPSADWFNVSAVFRPCTLYFKLLPGQKFAILELTAIDYSKALSSLKPKLLCIIGYLKTSSPYLKENTTFHHCREQLLNAFKEIIAVYTENNTKTIHKNIQNKELQIIKIAGHIFTIRLTINVSSDKWVKLFWLLADSSFCAYPSHVMEIW